MDQTRDATPGNGGWWLLLNGKSAGDAAVREAVQTLRQQGQPITVRVSWEAGDIERQLAEAVAAGAGTVIAGGGDGTLGMVAGALMAMALPPQGRPALAVLPLGTANDFASLAGLKEDTPTAVLQTLRTLPLQPVDLLRIQVDDEEERWSMNVVSGGYGAEVTAETPGALKDALGGLAYVIAGLGKLGQLAPMQATVRAGSFHWQGEAIALAIGNGRAAGGGQRVCPDAVIDDGAADLTIIPPLKGAMLETLAKVLADGRDAAVDSIAVRARAPVFAAELAAPTAFNLDGEPVQATRLHVQCVPAALAMHLPPGSPLLTQPGRAA